MLTMGRIGIDLYPLQVGQSLREVETFGKYLGGSPTNVAVAAARYGRRSAIISRTGADPFGDFIHDALRGFGVDDRYVTSVAAHPTPVTFCELFPPDDFPLYFYRAPKAPDLQIRAEDLDYDAIGNAGVLWVTATGLCQEPSRTAVLAAVQARSPSALTVLDLDYRPMFWESMLAARRCVAQILPHVTVVVGNLDEYEMAVTVRDPSAAAEAMREQGVALAVVKQGPRGVLACDAHSRIELPALDVKVVNGLGAGDAFGGALCHGLLGGWELEDVVGFANAAGAIVASRLPCAAAMPYDREVRDLLRETGSAVGACSPK